MTNNYIYILPLILALCLNLRQLIFPSRKIAVGQFSVILLSFLILDYYFSQTTLAWLLLLSFWNACVGLFSKNLPVDFSKNSLRILAVININFLGLWFFPLFSLTPPPLLTLGYAGFSVPLAFTLSALLTRPFNPHWVRWTRPWALIAWSILTLEILLKIILNNPTELGHFLLLQPFLMPWLIGIALIHSLIVTEKRHLFHHWTILLAIAAFSFNPEGVIITLGSVLLYVFTFRDLLSNTSIIHNNFNLISRENFLRFNNILLSIATVSLLFTIFLTGFNYFTPLFILLSFLLLGLMGIGPLCHWQKNNADYAKKLFKKLSLSIMVSLALSGIVCINTHSAFLGVTLACFAIMAIAHRAWDTRQSPMTRNRLGMWLAHIGLGVGVIGIALHNIITLLTGGLLIFLGGLCSASKKYIK